MVIEIVFSSLLIELAYVSLQLISSSVCYIQFLMFVLAILSKLDKEFWTNGMYVFTTWMHRKWNGFNTHQKTRLNKEEKCKGRLAINLKWTNKILKPFVTNKVNRKQKSGQSYVHHLSPSHPKDSGSIMDWFINSTSQTVLDLLIY